MKVLMLSIDSRIFDKGSAVRERLLAYGKLAEELHVVCYTRGGLSAEKLGDTVYLYPTNTRFKATYFLSGWCLSRRIVTRRDIWVVDSQEAMTNLLGVALKIFSRVKLHVQIHTDFMSPFFKKESFKNKLRYIGYRLGIYFADAVRVASQRIKDSIRISSRTPMAVLPIFTEIHEVRHEDGINLKEKYPGLDFMVLIVSRLEPEKDLGTALKAFSIMSRGIHNAGLFIAGSGSEEVALESMVKNLGIQERVVFLGWQDKLAGLYDSADAYLLTSLYEGYGRTLIEAAARGCPIVSTDVGVVGDVFIDGQSALVAQVGDYSTIAKHLEKLANNETLRLGLVSEAHRAQSSHVEVSWEAYLDAYRRSWEKCL